MEEEIKNIQESIRQIYKIDLLRYPEKTKKMLWVDHIKQVYKLYLVSSFHDVGDPPQKKVTVFA